MVGKSLNFTLVKNYLDECLENNLPAQAAANNVVKKYNKRVNPNTISNAFWKVYKQEIVIGEYGSFTLVAKSNRT